MNAYPQNGAYPWAFGFVSEYTYHRRVNIFFFVLLVSSCLSFGAYDAKFKAASISFHNGPPMRSVCSGPQQGQQGTSVMGQGTAAVGKHATPLQFLSLDTLEVGEVEGCFVGG